MSSATEPRILCYVTDRNGLGPGSADAEPEASGVARLLARIRMAIEAGVDWVQIREKDLSGKLPMELAREAVAAAGARTRVIVNDRLDVAVAARAGGVHLGRESLPVREVAEWRAKRKNTRPALEDFLIGASCHSIEEVRTAADDGADYVILGPVFETPSKMRFGAPLGTEKLCEACQAVQIPVIAIGGVNESNAQVCFRAGAGGIAAIRLFQGAVDAEDLKRRVEALRG